MIDSAPFERFKLQTDTKRVVTFMHQPPPTHPNLPIEQDGARILALSGREAFSGYVVTARGPVFMVLLEKTLGKDITIRTWDTLMKVVVAGDQIP